jgi:hypothetical protein
MDIRILEKLQYLMMYKFIRSHVALDGSHPKLYLAQDLDLPEDSSWADVFEKFDECNRITMCRSFDLPEDSSQMDIIKFENELARKDKCERLDILYDSSWVNIKNIEYKLAL